MTRICLLATALAATWGTCGITFGGSKPAGSRNGVDAAAKQAVDGVLSGERDGSVTNRARRLRGTVRQTPQFAPAQWQSGRVQLDGEWVPIRTSITRLTRDKTLAEYRAQRAKTAKTVAGQLELAAWCLKRKLYAQQRAHLTAVLEINPNHAAARKALGFVRMGPFWMSQRELQQRREEAKQAAKDLKRWGPKVKSIRDALTSGSRLRYNQGLKRLKAIDDPAAIPAIELGLAYDNAELALVVIDYLGEKAGKESTLALARQGIFSPWKSLRKRAAEKLKSRTFEYFVPPLLEIIATPIRSRPEYYIDSQGTILLRDVYFRETKNARFLDILNHLVLQRNVSVATFYWEPRRTLHVRLPQQLGDQMRPDLALQNHEAVRQITATVQDRSRIVDDLNDRTNELNSRVFAIASTVSGIAFQGDPRRCWKWWNDYVDARAQVEKPVYITERTETSFYYEPYVTYTRNSCLVAGTPVWTDRGPVAIDKVQIGDLVLSQNVETGELAYKPVLKTTVRPKRPLLSLEIGPRTVGMTGGHPFWISGKGWMKARDIKAGMTMRDVTGTTTVRPAGTATAAPTYNLIVADFHTYFVGDTKVLSHDNTPIEPTNVVVPGLRRTR